MRRPLPVTAGREHLSQLALDEWYAEIRRLSVGYITARPGVDRRILERATVLRRELAGLSTGYRKAGQAADLCLYQGLLSGICAYASLDLGFPDAAVTQSRATFLMGELAGHDGLRAWALGTRSLIARFQKRYDEALGYVRQGFQYANSGTALVRLRSGEGQTLAHMGDAEGAVRSLELARAARDEVRTPDVANGLFYFSEAKQAYYSGSSLQWLPGERNAASAQQESERAIQMFRAEDPESRSLADELLAHVYVANSRLTLGEIEGSLEALRPVLGLPPDDRNSWHVMRMRQIASRLADRRFAGSRIAVTAMGEVSAFASPGH